MSEAPFAAKKDLNKTEEQRNFFSEKLNFGEYNYKAFVEWKNTEFIGKYMTINSDGRRMTGYESKYHQAPTIRFFGGSTMWGYGVADDSTIPTLIARKEQLNVVNYAEQGYNSRQSLNALIENINEIKKGDLVVFYEGVNDSHNCFKENSTNGHLREGYIREALREKRRLEKYPTEIYYLGTYYMGKFLWSYYAKTNTYELIARAKRRLFGDETGSSAIASVCGDASKAEEVANFLVTSWKVSEIVVKGIGAKFACVLQPNPYTLGFEPHFSNVSLAQMANSVYPLVRQKARDLDCFVDLSQSLQKDYYLDACCHVNREGNEEIANLLYSRVIRSAFEQDHASKIKARISSHRKDG